jgi:BMFP domain-containing protein YqiC
MQSQKRIFDDIAHVAGGALGAISGLKQEMEALIRDRVERFMANGNFVGRDEFDAVKEMAATARAEQERLAMRVEKLEQMLAKSASRAPRRTGKKSAT